MPLDCYKDKVSNRRLRYYFKPTGIAWPAKPTEANLKPMYESCKAGAEARKFDYFGIQNKVECWGDDIVCSNHDVRFNSLKTDGVMKIWRIKHFI